MADKIIELDSIIAQVTALVKQAYDLGAQDRQAAILQAVTGGVSIPVPPVVTLPSVKLNLELPKPHLAERGYRPGTHISYVHEYIVKNPGLSTATIVRDLQLGDNPMEPKTIKTSIYRLRDKWGGLIEQKGDRWYSKDSSVFS